jgi:peptidoglycan/LPS O-acetylase OafA/YrhL
MVARKALLPAADADPATRSNLASAPRSGNFDMIRLIAASAVIFGHSFLVVGGVSGTDYWTGQARSVAVCAVKIFFILSGYLVTQSFERSPSWLRFVLARSLRIFPGLVACTLFSALVLGPVFTKLSVFNYLTHEMVFRFIIYNSVLDVLSYPFLPEVTFHIGRLGNVINGSLWSLPYEFTFYAIVLILGLARRLNGYVVTILLGLTLGSITFYILDDYGWFLSYFAAGMCMFFLRKRHRFNGLLAMLAGFGALVGHFGPLPWALLPIIGAYFVIYVAVDAPFAVKNATRFGDLSYGIYLYGWPCQQVAVHVLGSAPSWWQIFVVALPSAAMLACLSWHVVERPTLRWKDAQLSGFGRRVGANLVLAYGATTVLFGLGKIFVIACLLPAALAMAGGQILIWAWSRLALQTIWSNRSPANSSAKYALRSPSMQACPSPTSQFAKGFSDDE